MAGNSPHTTRYSIRPATSADAPDLARLIDMAGEGIPAWLWSQMDTGRDPFDTGAARAAREEGGFSYRNATIAVHEGEIAGMLLGYLQPGEMAAHDLESEPEVVRPLIELEALAPATWYVNAVAVFDRFQGLGIGKGLMQLAEEYRREAGADALSLIVAEENRHAKALYERLGYVDVARRPTVPFEGFEYGGDWVLMVTKPGRE